jgi:predicted transposase/invertase (TIGR01784 family)
MMSSHLGVYLNPFTDYGFKKLFGEESSKRFLLDFVNTLLPEHHQIISLEYSKNEHLGLNYYDRKAIVDIHCKTHSGETVIIELQKSKQNYFKDRSIYYASFPIIEQAKKGEWNYELKSVYTIGILDFTFDDDDNDTVIHTVQLKDQNNTVFYDKLNFIYITMPNFKKGADGLLSHQDKWLYLFKHLSGCDEVPSIYNQDNLFKEIFEKAQLVLLSHEEQQVYRSSLKKHWDLTNSIQDARSQGKAEGLLEGKLEGILEGKLEGKLEGILEVAKNLKRVGISIDNIILATGLSEAQINNL